MFLFVPFCASLTIYEAVERRTALETCQRYQEDYLPTPTGPFWSGSTTNECDPGEAINQDDFDKAEKRINFFRYMLGQAPIYENSSFRKASQEGCAILSQYGSLTHHPSEDFKCYTKLGDDALGASNLYQTYINASLTDSIEAYMNDQTVETVGHRRHIIAPTKLQWSGGVKDHFTNLYIQGMTNRQKDDPLVTSVKFVAYPIGIVPINLCYNQWSLSHVTNATRKCTTTPDGKTSCVYYLYPKIFGPYKITAYNSKGENIITSTLLSNVEYGYSDAIVFKVNRTLIKAGEVYIVHAKSESDGFDVSYSVRPINCNDVTTELDYSEELENKLLNPNEPLDSSDYGTKSNDPENSGSSLGPGAIAGIVIAVIVVIVLAIVGFLIYQKKFKKDVSSSS
ncbi:CAP domain-containing protein [Histomonas meleagridis]|uniref:CAP domain-containing protein n=1 Tax=Histomonas meleagridis TaxID=135588 RepID=UPI00355A4ADC|nr:CAP domain-containing protein [Histomonas meleagridis]KAH0806054.1 CAP domain-containing protein [Histomonas meleagridis]